MDINIGEEKIIELIATFTDDMIREKAMAKRVDAFGSIVKFMQRPKPDEITVSDSQKRYESFWYASARAVYKYDRRHHYQVPVADEVQGITLYDIEHPVEKKTFQLDAMEHCREELTKELMLEPNHGTERDYSKYLAFGGKELESLESVRQEGELVVLPEIRSSYLVGKMTQALMKTIQADTIFEERIDVEKIILYLRPVYAFEFYWKTKDKRQIVEMDALTGEVRSEQGQIKKHLSGVLENDDLFDIGSDVVGTFVPGANIAIKLGRFAARKVIK